MLSKLRLDQKGKYEQTVAAQYLAAMVVGFIDSREHALRVGREQGGIEHWDDMVVEHHNGIFEHVQIKRQDTDFDGTYLVVRGQLSKGISTGAPQPLSTLDNAILSLGNYFHPQNGNTNGPERKFSLKIPHPQIDIKKGLPIRHFVELCDACHVQGATSQGLASRAQGDQPTQHLFQWLTTWCGFTDWDHIFAVLSRLKIFISRNENDLDLEIIQTLEPHFNTPDIVRTSIMQYICDNSSDIAVTTPCLLFNHLRQYLRVDRPTWTQYCHDPLVPKWIVSGTHGQSETDIESVSDVVPALWSFLGRDRKLNISAVCPDQIQQRSLPAALSRLALHLPNPGQALFSGVNGWRRSAYQAVSGTLGLEDDDPHNLPWAEHSAALNTSDVREINGIQNSRVEADDLVVAMNDVTWDEVCKNLTEKIDDNIKDEVLLGAIEKIWSSWSQELCQNKELRNALLVKMLHPSAEGDDLLGVLRLGPRTIGLLVEGLFLLLIVTVGLGDDEASWENLGNAGTIRTIGLRRWGGPVGRRKGPCHLYLDGDFLLAKETADVVILSGVHCSPSDIENLNMAETLADNDNFAKQRMPDLLVTNSVGLGHRLRDATHDSIRAYFSGELNRRRTVREENLDRSSGGEQC